jgi:hypothetical protein
VYVRACWLGRAASMPGGASSGGIPESNASVGGSATRGDQSVLMGGPCDGLDGGLVVREADHGGGAIRPPDEELIVVPPRCQLPIVWRPIQTTYLDTEGLQKDKEKKPPMRLSSGSDTGHIKSVGACEEFLMTMSC